MNPVSIEGIDRIIKKLEAKARQKMGDGGKKTSYMVGYTANYAIWVHENIEMKWRGLPRIGGKGLYWEGSNGGQGQAKYLEQPARELKKEFSTMIKTAVGNGASLSQAIALVALRLQRESQLLVPVEFGNLKASAFTRKEY